MFSKVDAAPGALATMDVNVSGKHVAVGDALRSRIDDELAARVGKYFDRGGQADVVVHREGHQFCVDLVIRLASGQRLVSKGLGSDAHAAFDVALTKLETRIRRYKRKLVSHRPHLGGVGARSELAAYTVLRAPDDTDDEDLDADDGGATAGSSGAPAGTVIAESQSEVRAMTVSMAVMELDLTDASVVMFRNVAHDGLSVVYRRPDGNIGWIDPQRTAGATGAAISKAN